MQKRLLEILACPIDAGELVLEDVSWVGEEIESGLLACQLCHEKYPIIKGVPRFVDTSSYAKAYDYTWSKHRIRQLDMDREFAFKWFESVSGLTRSDLKGSLVLDAGCGMGGKAIVARDYGAEVVAMDLSNVVERPYKDLADDPRVHFVQADTRKPPFKPGTFDYVYSIGVIHHMPVPSEALPALVGPLKSGGRISVNVYAHGSGLYEYSKRLRKITTRLDPRLLFALCSLAVLALYPIYKLPVLKVFYPYLPISLHSNYLFRRLDTYEAYSTRYTTTHSHYEVFQWFKSAALTDIQVLRSDVAMSGTKP